MQKEEQIAYLIVNFGGPRDLAEVEEFLVTLLTDQEVIQTPFPPFLHRLLFTRVAKKRAQSVQHDYAKIGGKSPLFADTEAVAAQLKNHLKAPVLTFHRYLPKTHPQFLKDIHTISDYDRIRVFPLFPQFSYATTGSIALWFSRHLKKNLLNKLDWVKSYPAHTAYLNAFAATIREHLEIKKIKEEETILLFSAHGLPKDYVAKGDIYEKECLKTFYGLTRYFPKALSKLCYQSQFGKKEWLRPYTQQTCQAIDEWGGDYKNVLVVPLSFTSDHMETLFEVEEQYIPILREKGRNASRCPALNLRRDWLDAIVEMLSSSESASNQMLIRR